MTGSLYDHRSTVSGAGVLSFGSAGALGGGPTLRNSMVPFRENRGAAESATTMPFSTPGVDAETSSAAGVSPLFQRYRRYGDTGLSYAAWSLRNASCWPASSNVRLL